MEDYSNFLKSSLDYKRSREDRFKEVSRDALFKASKKKIQTTMIGALSTIEEHFGFRSVHWVVVSVPMGAGFRRRKTYTRTKTCKVNI